MGDDNTGRFHIENLERITRTSERVRGHEQKLADALLHLNKKLGELDAKVDALRLWRAHINGYAAAVIAVSGLVATLLSLLLRWGSR